MEGNDGAADVSPSEDDDVLREQSFKRPQGLNLDSFMVATSPADDPSDSEGAGRTIPPSEDPPIDSITQTTAHGDQADGKDAAVGDVKALFTMERSEDRPADSTTQMAVHGEQTIGKGLAVSMVVVWTAIGALVGTVLPPVLGGLGLLTMAMVGLWLGER